MDDNFLGSDAVTTETEDVYAWIGEGFAWVDDLWIVDVELADIASHKVYDLQFSRAVDGDFVSIEEDEGFFFSQLNVGHIPHMPIKCNAVLQVVCGEGGVLSVCTFFKVRFESEEEHIPDFGRWGFQLYRGWEDAIGGVADFKTVWCCDV